MARIVSFATRGRRHAIVATSQNDQLWLKDSANLFQALAIITDAEQAFLRFAEEAQTPAALVAYLRLAHKLNQSATSPPLSFVGRLPLTSRRGCRAIDCPGPSAAERTGEHDE